MREAFEIGAIKKLTDNAAQFEVKGMWSIFTLAKEIRAALEQDNTAYNALVKKYSSDGKKVDNDRIVEFQEENQALKAQEIELSIDPIDMKFPPPTFLTVTDVLVLEPFVNLVKEEDKPKEPEKPKEETKG